MKKTVSDNLSPALFLISSPLQVLCLYEALYSFNISEYTVFVVTERRDKRNSQIVEMLKSLHIKYNMANLNNVKASWNILGVRNDFNGLIDYKYDTIFVGDYFNNLQLATALKYSNRGCKIIYMDDGNSTIEVFKKMKHYTSYKDGLIRKLFKVVAYVKNLNHDDHFFTVYDKLETSKVVYPNTFSHITDLITATKATGSDSVFFVGTNNNMYCKFLGLSLDDFDKLFIDSLAKMKVLYPNKRYIYIPHGRDDGAYTTAVCQKYNIEYRTLNSAIELYLINNNIVPYAVCGFTSSALFNIKSIMPSVDSINILPSIASGSTFNSYSVISECYQSIGIKNIFL